VPTIGLTGGIAAGKSAVAARLAELGAVLVDADRIAREVVEPGTAGLAAVVEAFGNGVLAADGSLDRPALGAIVFNDEAARQRLNAIVHPLVRAEAARRLREAGPEAVVVQDIPLLVETGQAGNFDLVLTVRAPLGERLRRMVEDRKMAEDDARARIAAQATDEERAAVSDVVLDNSGTLEELRAAVDHFWRERVEPLVRAGRP
jgi:dephospho-CoA kinase